MHTQALSLNEAFLLVRDRKPDVSPNFHFMEQLHSFERQLQKPNLPSPNVVVGGGSGGGGGNGGSDDVTELETTKESERLAGASSTRAIPPLLVLLI